MTVRQTKPGFNFGQNENCKENMLCFNLEIFYFGKKFLFNDEWGGGAQRETWGTLNDFVTLTWNDMPLTAVKIVRPLLFREKKRFQPSVSGSIVHLNPLTSSLCCVSVCVSCRLFLVKAPLSVIIQPPSLLLPGRSLGFLVAKATLELVGHASVSESVTLLNFIIMKSYQYSLVSIPKISSK